MLVAPHAIEDHQAGSVGELLTNPVEAARHRVDRLGNAGQPLEQTGLEAHQVRPLSKLQPVDPIGERALDRRVVNEIHCQDGLADAALAEDTDLSWRRDSGRAEPASEQGGPQSITKLGQRDEMRRLRGHSKQLAASGPAPGGWTASYGSDRWSGGAHGGGSGGLRQAGALRNREQTLDYLSQRRFAFGRGQEIERLVRRPRPLVLEQLRIHQLDRRALHGNANQGDLILPSAVQQLRQLVLANELGSQKIRS